MLKPVAVYFETTLYHLVITYLQTAALADPWRLIRGGNSSGALVAPEGFTDGAVLPFADKIWNVINLVKQTFIRQIKEWGGRK